MKRLIAILALVAAATLYAFLPETALVSTLLPDPGGTVMAFGFAASVATQKLEAARKRVDETHAEIATVLHDGFNDDGKTPKNPGKELTKEDEGKLANLTGALEEQVASVQSLTTLQALSPKAMEDARQQSAQDLSGAQNISTDEADDKLTKESQAFRQYIMGGWRAVHQAGLEDHMPTYAKIMPDQQGGQALMNVTSVPSNPADVGIPVRVNQALTNVMRLHSVVMSLANVVPISSTAELNDVVSDDTATKGTWQTENEDAADSGNSNDVPFAAVKYTFQRASSRTARLSNAVLYGTDLMNMEAEIANALGIRLARLYEETFTTGATGFTAGTDLVARATNVAEASNSSITPQTLDNAIHTLDPAYRDGANFMMNSSTLSALYGLYFGGSTGAGDGMNRVVQYAAQSGASQDRYIRGYMVRENHEVASIGAGAVPILFGNFSNYRIYTVPRTRVLSVFRTEEKYAAQNQTGFHIGEYLAANLRVQKAIAKITMAS